MIGTFSHPRGTGLSFIEFNNRCDDWVAWLVAMHGHVMHKRNCLIKSTSYSWLLCIPTIPVWLNFTGRASHRAHRVKNSYVTNKKAKVNVLPLHWVVTEGSRIIRLVQFLFLKNSQNEKKSDMIKFVFPNPYCMGMRVGKPFSFSLT